MIAAAKTSPRLLVSLTLALLCSVATSCSPSNDAAAPARGRAPVPVVVAQAVTRDVPMELSSVGAVEPIALVTVRPQVTGRIEKIHFAEGQDVRAGDVLATLDPSPWQAALQQAAANLRRDEARLLNARLEFQRASNLFATRIASEQDYQSAEAAFLAAESIVHADAAAVTNAMVNLAYTEIRAPIDGRTGALQVKAGNVVKAPDDPIVTIVALRPVHVAFSLPEQHLGAIRARAAQGELRVEAFAPAEPDRKARGVLAFINNRVTPGTGTILLKAAFENADLALWPGQFVNAVLTLSNLVNATVIPSHAVQSGQAGDYVFVVREDQTAEMRPVKSVLTHQGFTAIATGLQAGETVVADGHLRVTPGAKLAIKDSAPARDTANSVTRAGGLPEPNSEGGLQPNSASPGNLSALPRQP